MTERAGPGPWALGPGDEPRASTRRESDDYVELHCHSSFSLLDGASPPEALAARAHALGHRALALTDHDDLGGIVRFAQASAEVGLGGIVGAELTVDVREETTAERRAPSAERQPSAERRAPSAERQPARRRELDEPTHLVLLAETRAGYANLSTLVTRARMDAPRGFPRVPLELVARHADGLFALTGCPRGWVPSLLADGREDEARRAAGTLAEIFGGRLAIEAWDHGLPEERATVAGLLRVARALDLPWVVTNDVHYAEPRGRVVHDVLQCLRHQRSLDEMGTRLRPSGEWSLRSAAAMRRRWRHDLAGVRETLAVAERCAFRLEHLRPTLPAFPLPPGVTADEYLARLVEQGAHERWGPPGTARRTEKHDRQLAHEIALIGRLGLAGYFLIVWDIVRFASREGILCQGRGSAANSAVCYCLGITAVDPVRLELLFERFLSEERQEAPDIDIDFAHDDRERVLQYVYERYGREHAAMVCEQITYRGRSAVRDAARVLGFSVEQADVLSLLSDRFSARATAERLRISATAQVAGAGPGSGSEGAGGSRAADPDAAVAQALGDGMVRGTEATTRARAVTEATRKEMLRGPATCTDTRADEREAKLVAASAGRPLTSRDRPRPAAAYEPYGSPSAQQAKSAREYATPSAMPGRPAERRGPSAERRHPHEDPYASPTPEERRNPTTAMRETGVDADAILERAGLDPSDHRVRVLADIVEGLHQLPRHRSIHVGGFVLTAEPLSSVVPIEPASMPGRTVIQWEKDDLDPVGLVKIDLLGLGMLSVLQRCMRYVRETRGVTLDLGQLDTTDQAVYDDLCRADTVGVFQVESRAQMNTLPRLKPRCFYDLVVEVALIRPGPIQGEMVHPYLRRRAGVEAVTYPHPSLEPILKRTLGVPLFQEQGMQVAITAAGFTPGEADTLRRAMGHKRSRERMAAICRKMIDGMKANGFDEATAMRVYNQINAFADYGFPESHSA
ncbi:MAG TPA: PHP domain-containing protein, partial [Gemmatimonadaceae bacterium]